MIHDSPNHRALSCVFVLTCFLWAAALFVMAAFFLDMIGVSKP